MKATTKYRIKEYGWKVGLAAAFCAFAVKDSGTKATAFIAGAMIITVLFSIFMQEMYNHRSAHRDPDPDWLIAVRERTPAQQAEIERMDAAYSWGTMIAEKLIREGRNNVSVEWEWSKNKKGGYDAAFTIDKEKWHGYSAKSPADAIRQAYRSFAHSKGDANHVS